MGPGGLGDAGSDTSRWGAGAVGQGHWHMGFEGIWTGRAVREVAFVGYRR